MLYACRCPAALLLLLFCATAPLVLDFDSELRAGGCRFKRLVGLLALLQAGQDRPECRRLSNTRNSLTYSDAHWGLGARREFAKDDRGPSECTVQVASTATGSLCHSAKERVWSCGV